MLRRRQKFRILIERLVSCLWGIEGHLRRRFFYYLLKPFSVSVGKLREELACPKFPKGGGRSRARRNYGGKGGGNGPKKFVYIGANGQLIVILMIFDTLEGNGTEGAVFRKK